MVTLAFLITITKGGENMDQWAATYWEVTQPGFESLIISGMWFSTPEEAENYGKTTFGEYFAGVQQVSWANNEKPF